MWWFLEPIAFCPSYCGKIQATQAKRQKTLFDLNNSGFFRSNFQSTEESLVTLGDDLQHQ